MCSPKIGTWWVSSKSDPRWNKQGRAKGFVILGGPLQMRDWINLCKENYGKPPKDTEMGFIKD